uniref:C-type lectin-like n=1 Tax=Euleptes europaea TaxID=460621 RepID=UPI00254261C0|nr:C-type lectin-like [Euleptes europaea]
MPLALHIRDVPNEPTPDYKAEATSCPKGWLSYVNNCYGLFPDKLTWKEAKEECSSLGQSSHLASILTDTEQTAVNTYLTSSFSGVGNIWFGLKDKWKIRRWTWEDGSKTKDYRWTSGAPSFLTGSKYCAYMIESEGFKTWQDADCSLKFAFLCKMTS